MRTRQSVCARKMRYGSREEAAVVARSNPEFRVYQCDRCRRFHLTSRIKGKWVPRPWRD